MPKIEISEIDLTTPGSSIESTDVVYVPGFVDPDYADIEFGKPELFTSVAQFVSRCGKVAPKFGEDQTYAGIAGFETYAIPSGVDAAMFKAGEVDPGYRMAKELLAAGLNVLFERVNDKKDPECVKVELSNTDTDYEYAYVKKIVYKEDGKTKADNTGASGLFYMDDNGKMISYNTPTNRGEMYEDPKATADYKPFDVENGNIYVALPFAITAADMYTFLSTAYTTEDVSRLSDRGNYSIKYLTSGGYPVFEYSAGTIVSAMLNLAEDRGDCVALIDHTDNPKREISTTKSGSVYHTLQQKEYENGDFGAMFTPWATYNRTTSDVVMSGDVEKKEKPVSFRAPGSFAYLMSLADSIKTNANWLAIAGAARGGVRNLADGGMDVVIPNGVADVMQPRNDGIAINAITNIKPYGLTIWGNRTLKKNEGNLVATSFLNVRNLVSDIKKTCYRAARKATFEQDTDILWVNFKSEIAKLLERMKSGYGISGYKIVRDNDHERANDKATLCAKIIIYPTYAVEDFYITVVLQDDEVSVN